MRISRISNNKDKKQYKNKSESREKENVNWSEIMNINMQTLKRGKGGAMRRK
ncbi:hypothetical protein JOC75_004032 [Metabacillus crassostreae]|uniref:hypothetical protein n=1 Tax=Metabacillus crassostreae TaxID=929098 RepID=UPI00195B83AD|nr:hypothetical protein [Metabacillus crassostreae]MBM7606004.1 hypothetical protein [Metabacillus crassostreae]